MSALPELIGERRIEKPWIGLAGFHAITRMIGEARDGDLLPHLATHLEVFGNLIQIPQELVGRGRSVERRIVAHRSEQWLVAVLVLAILTEAFPGKYALGVLLQIDLAFPAFIGPGGSAEANQWGKRESHREGNCTVSLAASSTDRQANVRLGMYLGVVPPVE